jgi:hypothetical protein
MSGVKRRMMPKEANKVLGRVKAIIPDSNNL